MPYLVNTSSRRVSHLLAHSGLRVYSSGLLLLQWINSFMILFFFVILTIYSVPGYER